MRNPRIPQSHFTAPLNEILGTEANVRVLRELCRADSPMARTTIAERAGLSLPGTSAAVAKLQRSGIVEAVGAGTRQSFGFRHGHPLAPALRTLFLAETLRTDALHGELRSLLGSLSSTPRAAWIVESEAPDEPGAPLRLSVLGAARDLPELASAIQGAIGELGSRYDTTIEVRATTEADLATASPAEHAVMQGATPVFGPHPLTFIDGSADAHQTAGPKRATHADRDHQAALSAAWIADQLNRDPSLPKRARNWLVHRLHVASPREAAELDDWLHVLESSSIPRIQHLLLSPGERAVRLRQSNPFIPVLTDRERDLMRKAATG
ncbi:winged helix-turn-helix domain-containing protein [Longimicrobium terrae]|uniref:DNA-binding Lrp family transcriptional regulator n=1 Tax=Longimicrobium terrae TaxID=1639882 RepID=A0A841GYM1_9BACT|nr:winged helix-turn-helix domain-containing protein [Longimicrobium terrae]MBB4636667.1 DNA-binding Lrp family transcriptional regulator [Longimicrobium terrae]MBB6070809.1 DNA-binding Lrp family transcriptional regulator [Longimicrobium terrae]NNC28835.1 winged helix-turn-helix transcriptional regulator [Longimicrobium terrae]